jgi:UDP-N-acetylmuramyl pentapeptide phosphotransferase/UDP-N-acetylglucosamine-1-phosphate transferase
MNPLLKTGAAIVAFAFLSYTFAVVDEQRRRRIAPHALALLTLGVLLDVTATVFMVLGSNNAPFTLHGLLGYSSLVAMLAATALLWRLAVNAGVGAPVPRGLHLFTRAAYFWWATVFAIEGLLAAIR